jgi:CubicO group peptidase (beta-lactamase class C family)/beta-glucanase (GH16 family)
MHERWFLAALASIGLIAVSARIAHAATEWDEAADYSRSCEGQVLLVLKDGKEVFQDCAVGWRPDRPHPLASGTKSFTGIAAMLAVQQGLISLDERVSDTLTEWKQDPRKSRITVRELLNLSSGLEPDSREDRDRIRAIAGPGNAAERLRAMTSGRDDFFGQGVAAPAEHEPGTRFAYGSNHFFAFGAFLERRLQARGVKPDTLWEWYERNLFAPLDMKVANIGRDRMKQPQIAGGASLSAREWAKFGEFARLGGACVKPDGTRSQLLRTDLLEKCFEPSAANPRYGLTWWLGPVATKDGSPATVVAAGLGNQRLYVVPSAGLVVVRFAPLNSERGTFNDQVMLDKLLTAVGAPTQDFPKIDPGMAERIRQDLQKDRFDRGADRPRPGPPPDELGMKLIFADSFDSAGAPDPAKWGHEIGFVRNKELQWYRPENARCEDGLLVITATREPVPNPNFAVGSDDWRMNRHAADYASASLVTKGKFEFTYGRVRMRARIDTRPGLWPAFWAKGTRHPWPVGGEIDIMEYFAGLMMANVAWAGEKAGAVQWDASRTSLETIAKDAGYADMTAWSRDFHEWQFDWTETSMEFRIDGRLLNTVDLSRTINSTPDHANPFHEPQAFILNLAIGGTSGGDPANTEFPARLEVDWIRVWQPLKP